MADEKYNFQAEKFKVFVRYLIQVAKDKRCVLEMGSSLLLTHGS